MVGWGWGQLQQGLRAAQTFVPPQPASSVFSTVNFDHFQILRAIGKGSFGKVRKAAPP